MEKTEAEKFMKKMRIYGSERIKFANMNVIKNKTTIMFQSIDSAIRSH
jgi:hypothetical protein